MNYDELSELDAIDDSISGSEWRDLPGYEGHYMVSQLGQVKSTDQVVPCNHFGTRIRRGRILAVNANAVNLTRGRKQTARTVASIMREVWPELS